jgi:hypothetical protein
MNFGLLGIALFSVLVFVWLGIVTFKILRKRELPIYHYTPFDYITAHTTVEFHEEKEEHEDEDDQGDDKEKFRYKLKKG